MTEATAKKQIFYIYDILNLKKHTDTRKETYEKMEKVCKVCTVL